MDPARTLRALATFEGRGPGTDAERRAALWVRDFLRNAGRDALVETVWVRPHWAATHAMHAALGAGASALAVAEPVAGLALGLAVAVSLAGDLTGAFFLLRRLTPERATQNVVSPSPQSEGKAVRLTVTASLDAPRSGAAYRRPWISLYARMRRALRLPSAPTLLLASIVLICGFAVARLAGVEADWLGVAQLVPTLVLLAGVAVLIDIALSDHSPAANTGASAPAAALALVGELDRQGPRNLAVELVVAGAGQGPSLGMRSYVRKRRRRVRPAEVAVVAVEPCGGGSPRWWTHDGPLVPLRLHPQLVAAAAAAARDEPSLNAAPARGNGAGAAYRARAARWPAIAVGCLDERGTAPRAGTPEDTADRIDPIALDATVTLCLALIGRLDARLDDVGAGASGVPAR